MTDLEDILIGIESQSQKLKNWENYVKSVFGHDLTRSELELLFKTYIPTGKIIEELYFYDDDTLYYTTIPFPFSNIVKDVYLYVYSANPNEWINHEMDKVYTEES